MITFFILHLLKKIVPDVFAFIESLDKIVAKSNYGIHLIFMYVKIEIKKSIFLVALQYIIFG